MRIRKILADLFVSIVCLFSVVSVYAAGNEDPNQDQWISENDTCNLHVNAPCDSEECAQAETLGCFNQIGHGCSGNDYIATNPVSPFYSEAEGKYILSFNLYCQSDDFTHQYLFEWKRPLCQDGDSLDDTASGEYGTCIDRDQAERLEPVANKECTKVGNPCDAESGNKIVRETDYEGNGVHFYRTWQSMAPKNMSPVGSRWMHSYFDSLDIDAQNVPLAVTTPDGEYQTLVETTGGTYIATAINSLRVKAAGSDWITEYPNGERRRYDSNGRLVNVEVAPGQITTLTYNANDELTHITGPFGHQVGIWYSSGDGTKMGGLSWPDGGNVQYLHTPSASNGNYPLIEVRGKGSGSFTKKYHYTDSNFPDYITQIEDKQTANYATYTYDPATGKALTSEHAGGAGKVTLAYSTDSTTVTDGDGRVETYNFGVSPFVGRRLSSTVKNGTTTSQIFASSSSDPDLRRIESVTDALGNVTTYGYDDHHRTTVTRASGTPIAHTTTHEFLRDDSNKVTKIKKPSAYSSSDAETTITYNSLDLPLTITEAGYDTSQNPISRTTTFTYNTSGQVLTVDGPRTDVTDVTTYEYHNCTTGGKCGQLKKITNAAGHVTEFTNYSSLGQVTRIVDIAGFVHEYNRNTLGQIYSYRKWAPSLMYYKDYSLSYNSVDLLATAPAGNGMKDLTYTYDDARRLIQVTDVQGNKLKYEYDSAGNVTEESAEDSTGNISRLVNKTYDNFSRLDTISNAGAVTDILLDAIGNLTESEDPNLNVTDYIYDELNRLTETEDADNNSAFTAYDVNNMVTQVTAANGAATSFTYDDLGNLESETSPDRGTTSYTHDAAGNVLTVTDARNITATYTYDELNRVTSISYPTTSKNVTFGYDAGSYNNGSLTSMTDESGSTTWSLNSQAASKYGFSKHWDRKYQTTGGQLVYSSQMRSWMTDWLFTQYYGNGHWMNIGGTTNSQVGSVKFGGTNQYNGTQVLSNATYEPYGPVNGWTWGNGTNANFTHNQRGEVTSHKMCTDTRTLTYDAASQLLTQSDAEYNMTYTYDDIGRNKSFAATANNGGTLVPGSQVFTYGENGNRTSITEGSYYANTITANTNRLASTAGPIAKTYTYDAAGNVSSDGIHTYVYDDRGRLESIDNGATTYKYNGLGERVSKTTGGVTTLYLYNENGELLGEYNSSGQPIAEYAWMDGRPVAVKKGSTIYYVHSDHLGTPRAVSNGNTVVWRWDSDPFGSTAVDEDPDGNSTLFTYNLRFPGQYYDDESGLHYNYYRTYDPSTGRYMESDPIGLQGGLNSYAYASANPLLYYDPYGLYDWPSLPQGVVDAAAGFGDGVSSTLTFGLYSTADVRDDLGINGGVDQCSAFYSGSELAGLGVTVVAGAGLAKSGVSALAKAAGPRANWIRLGPSYSGSLERPVELSLRWGASTAKKGKYVNQIPNLTLRRANQWLRQKQIPLPGRRYADPGHLHIRF